MDDLKKLNILRTIADSAHKERSLQITPPGVLYALPAYVPSTRKFLYHVIMNDGTGIYGMRDRFGVLHMIDAWDWLAMGGLHLMAFDHNLEFVGAAEE